MSSEMVVDTERLTASGHRSPSRRSIRSQKWFRLVHVYTSMISMLVVLFFGLTGITLNHPSWTFGADPVIDTYSGSLPAGAVTDGAVDYLAISEFVRSTYDVKGSVSDYGTVGNEGSISFKGPGYAADVLFQVDTGSFDLSIEEQGLLAVLNDLHKGRDTDPAWNWAIDVSGGLLVVVSVTGIGIQVFQRKRRNSAFIVAGIAVALSVVLMLVTMV